MIMCFFKIKQRRLNALIKKYPFLLIHDTKSYLFIKNDFLEKFIAEKKRREVK